ncbi:hypothetical protein F3N42_05920 [Marinihelvus fidelis]|uniref:DUF4175 domain-containing protein n=1 Tax=Marinihelvus fidelis TaxID=2613842 RepID=A0A5N0TDH9_9GAMM|nr:hypothetical protein [Marinihelvus fidelis]KAA9132748.1 hypothetical protein F3N42_05920 [Marinihelvus fidelis]
MNGRRSLWTIFAVPLLLFVASLVGLVWALLDDGGADTVAAVAAGVSIPVLAWAWVRRGRGSVTRD